MQTKQQIERLLASAGVAPNKRLGQHFLIDLNLMRLLVDAAHIHANDVVLEVGCGTGSFTEALSEAAGRVITVEYDTVLARIARAQLEEAYNVTLIQGDVLESKNQLNREVVAAMQEATAELGGKLLLVANLPYSVAAPVMVDLIAGGAGQVVCDAMYVTVQKEVADRMVADPGGSDYGMLSVLMAATGKAQMLRKLKPSVFWPRPEVDSAMVGYQRLPEKADEIKDMALLKEVVSLFMGHRRKMLKACVKFAEGRLADVHHWADIFDRACAEPHRRPEELSAEVYISIANLCHEMITPPPQ
ncbi:MAG: ribosomal RNA small subunit methyltransferase A [Phycisphaerae bacterium]|nr:ribosomal RNA small subunit methyltransferase A [Phycisphaerae bacterium]